MYIRIAHWNSIEWGGIFEDDATRKLYRIYKKYKQVHIGNFSELRTKLTLNPG